MSYIGNTNTTQGFIPAIDYFSGNGSTTAFTLSRLVASVAQVQVTIDNVAQNPSTAFTVSGNTLTFTSAPLSGTNNIYVYYTSPITQVIAPGQGTVNTTALGNITNIASGNSSLTLQTGSSNTTAVTVDTSQNVGIGTTSPLFTAGSNGVMISGLKPALRLSSTTTGSGTWEIYADSASSGGLGFYERQNSTTAMYINEGGNVGIGTTSPSYRLHVVYPTTDNAIVLDNGGGAGDANAPYLAFSGTNNGASYVRGRIRGAFPTITGGGLVFDTGSSGSMSEAMRIDTSGNLLVGTTSTFSPGGVPTTTSFSTNTAGNWALGIRNTTTASNPFGLAIQYPNGAPNSGSAQFIFCQDNTGTKFDVRSNGGIGNYSANNANLSDRREKINFAPAKSYLNTICSIPVQTFNYIDQSEDDPGLTLGVVAQDVQAVAPEMVTESNWGTEEAPKMRLSIYQTDLQYALMKSIQELKAINDTQAETINALTARIVALENR